MSEFGGPVRCGWAVYNIEAVLCVDEYFNNEDAQVKLCTVYRSGTERLSENWDKFRYLENVESFERKEALVYRAASKYPNYPRRYPKWKQPNISQQLPSARRWLWLATRPLTYLHLVLGTGYCGPSRFYLTLLYIPPNKQMALYKRAKLCKVMLVSFIISLLETQLSPWCTCNVYSLAFFQISLHE